MHYYNKIIFLLLYLSIYFFSDNLNTDSLVNNQNKQFNIDIENSGNSDVYVDAVYGEWEIIEYIGTAMAAPGLSATIPIEQGGSNEIGTIFYVGEDFFEYREDKEDIILSCNILPLSNYPEEVCFLPNGMNMKWEKREVLWKFP